MNVAVRLTLFLLVLAAAFGVGAAIGAAVADQGGDEPAPAQEEMGP